MPRGLAIICASSPVPDPKGVGMAINVTVTCNSGSVPK